MPKAEQILESKSMVGMNFCTMTKSLIVEASTFQYS